MYIKSIRLWNYKCFRDSGLMEFGPGFNLITGQNSAGKTALLEALALQPSNHPHATLRSKPLAESTLAEHPKLQVSMVCSGGEFRDLIARQRSNFTIDMPATSDEKVTVPQELDKLFKASVVSFRFRIEGGNLVDGDGNGKGKAYSPSRYNASNRTKRVQVQFNGLDTQSPKITSGSNASENLASQLGAKARQQMYMFRAERMNIGSSKVLGKEKLQPNASNLPDVLNKLAYDPTRFLRYKALVRRVLPQVRGLSLNPSEGSVTIHVWYHDEDSLRPDLAVPLDQCGTGVSQVLAILYVVTQSRYPTSILIDEPGSFLHPGAARALLNVLRDHDQHQYVLATHSPQIISDASEGPIHYLSLNEHGEAEHTELSSTSLEDVLCLLRGVGADFGQVFGARGVLFVEGATEEACFPKIWRKLIKAPMGGAVVVGLIHTGDLEDKHAKVAAALYERMANAGGLLPKCLGFILDDEGRSKKKREKIMDAAPGMVDFLPRRTFENFLLDPDAIAAVLAPLDGVGADTCTPDDIDAWLTKRGSNTTYGKGLSRKSKPEEWIKKVDAPKLLHNLFLEFSENTQEYRKTTHSVELCDWLIEHKPDALDELVEVIRKRVAGCD